MTNKRDHRSEESPQRQQKRRADHTVPEVLSSAGWQNSIEQGGERARQQKAQWRRDNADHIRAYRARYDAAHRDRKNELARESLARVKERRLREQEKGKESERRVAARRERQREYNAVNREKQNEQHRQRAAERRAEDPESFKQRQREKQARWRENHRDEVNAARRRRRAAEPERYRQAAREYYDDHREVILAHMRADYAKNREVKLADAAQKRKRRDAGLPASRRHRVTRDDQVRNTRSADAFFARSWTDSELRQIREREILASRVESSRIREAHRRVLTRNTRAGQEAACRVQTRAEEERMDAIARGINDRLRRFPRRTPPAGLHPPTPAPTTGPEIDR